MRLYWRVSCRNCGVFGSRAHAEHRMILMLTQRSIASGSRRLLLTGGCYEQCLWLNLRSIGRSCHWSSGVIMQCQAERLQDCFPFVLFKTLRAVDREFCRQLPDFDIHYVYMLKLFDRLGHLFDSGSAVQVRQVLLCLRVLLRWIEVSGSKARLLCMHAPLVDDCVLRFWEHGALRLEGALLLEELASSLPEVARHMARWHLLACSEARQMTGGKFPCFVASKSYRDYERQAFGWESAVHPRGPLPLSVFLGDHAIRCKDLAWANLDKASRAPQGKLLGGGFVVSVG